MSSYVSAELRRIVEERAGGRREYCLIHQDDTFVGCQVDHVIAEKHGGVTDASNLALACAFCNRAKGSDIASIIPESQALVRLFNPRSDRWDDHFRIDTQSLMIGAFSDIGRATVRLLRLNDIERVLERQSLAKSGIFPFARPRPK
jgi:hypothetical protein